jgi:hypothetical protein
LIGPSQKKKKVETMEAPQNRRFYGNDGVSTPLAHTYIGEKGRTLGKTIGGYSKILLGTPLGNTLGA